MGIFSIPGGNAGTTKIETGQDDKKTLPEKIGAFFEKLAPGNPLSDILDKADSKEDCEKQSLAERLRDFLFRANDHELVNSSDSELENTSEP